MPAISGSPAAPLAPTNIVGVSGDGEVTLSWTPSANGGSPITGYTVTVSPGSIIEDVSGDVTTATITSLKNGRAYTFRVTAINAIGSSPASQASPPVTPARSPDAPTNVIAVLGINSASVSWTAPESNGGSPITGYTITPYFGVSSGVPVTVGSVLSRTITGLDGGVSIAFTVLAINSAGSSYASVPSSPVIPTSPIASPPSSVLGVTGVAGNISATIRWEPPVSNGGADITGYKVICVPDNKGGALNIAGPTARSLIITKGIKNAVLTRYTVVALNSVGQSDSVRLTAFALPSIPVVKVTRGLSGIINLVWTAKVSNIASPITGYLVKLVTPLTAPIEMVIPTPTITATGGLVSISGLTNGTSHVFSVQSVSDIGPSASRLSIAMIPATTPSVPTSFVGTKALASAGLAWVAPTNTGGLPITGYTITYVIGSITKILKVKTVLSAIVKGLVNGTDYTFTINATTLIGPSTGGPSVVVKPGA